MAANEICLQDIMIECTEQQDDLAVLQQQSEDLYQQCSEYYEQHQSHPPVMLREYIESLNRTQTLQQQLDVLENKSREIQTSHQGCLSWLENARKGYFECEINLFTKPHTERDLGKENNVIAASAPSTKVRFVYADSPDEPVDNGYIFYWVYDEFNPEQIEPDTYTGFTLASHPMLPVGVGRTDKNGRLRKSQFFKQQTFEHLQKKDRHYIRLGLTWDKNYSRFKGDKTIAENIELQMSQWNFFGQLKGIRPFYLAHSKANRKIIDTELNDTERVLQSMYAFHLSKRDFEQAETLIKQIKSWKTRNLIRQVSNEYFYLFKHYGFMCYPIDRGAFVTKDLHSLTQPDTQDKQPPVAFKGLLKPQQPGQPAQTTIAIHCTLPEWDRRIARQTQRVKTALDVYLTNQKDTQKVLGHLDGMLQCTLIHKRFSSERLEDTDFDYHDHEIFIKNIDHIKTAVETALDNEKTPDNQVSVKPEADDVDRKARTLRELLNAKALTEEFKRYWETVVKDGENTQVKAGPYMQEEPYWTHFFQTYCEAIIMLRHSGDSHNIFNEDIAPFLDWLIEQTDYSELAPGKRVKSVFENTDKLFVGQTEEDKGSTVDENIQKKSLLQRIESSTKNSNNNNSEEELIDIEQENILYIMFKGWQTLGGLFHRVPGPPSVLQVLLDVYADHISRKIQREALQKGSYHIRFMLMLCQRFGLFGEGSFENNKTLMYSALRAHGRLHAPGGQNITGQKNYYSHSALKERMKYIQGDYDPVLTFDQKENLNFIFESNNGLKQSLKTNFYNRPFPGFAANLQENSQSFSDTVYTASNHFAYKGIMSVINLGFMIESWINLPEQATRHWDEGEYLAYITVVSDTLGNSVITAYNTTRLAHTLRLSAMAAKITQAKNNALISLSSKEQETRQRLNIRDKDFGRLSPLMDNLAVSLSLLASVSAISDALEDQRRGKDHQAMQKWLEATSSALVTYGFYAGKYGSKGLFSYLGGKATGHSAKLMARFGLSLFIPFVGEATALAGAILSFFLVIMELWDMLVSYNRSTLYQRIDYHHNELYKLSDTQLEKYYRLEQGQLGSVFKALGHYDDLDFDKLHINSFIPLKQLDYPVEQIQDMLSNNDYLLISELTELYERVNNPELAEHYFTIEDKKLYFPEVARALKNGEFFKPGLSEYQQREQVLSQYARYQEYPEP